MVIYAKLLKTTTKENKQRRKREIEKRYRQQKQINVYFK